MKKNNKYAGGRWWLPTVGAANTSISKTQRLVIGQIKPIGKWAISVPPSSKILVLKDGTEGTFSVTLEDPLRSHP